MRTNQHPIADRIARQRTVVGGMTCLLLLVAVAAPARAVYLNLPHFYEQCDPQWGSDSLGTCSYSMCSDGCAVTSSAMLFAYYGGTMNPGELNTCLTNNGGYANGCLIYWTNNCMPAGVSYVDTSGDIDSELTAGRPVIAQVSNASVGMHFVVIVGNDNGQYQILDPYWPSYQTISAGSYTIDSIRRYNGNVAVNPCDVVVTNQGETIIDDTDACFVRHGAYWWPSSSGYDGHHYFTYAVDEPNPDCWAEWRFEVQDAGDYEVEVYIPDADADTQNARYTVDFGGGSTDVTVNQASASGWTPLGTFSFAAGADRSVALFDNTGEPLSADIPIGFDAVRLVPATTPGPDAGIPGPDATAAGDAGPPPDGAPSNDASPITDPSGAGGGCNCRAAPTPTTPALLLLLGLALLGLGRARRRPAPRRRHD